MGEEKSKFTDNSNPTASVNYTELDKSIMDSPIISNEPMDWGPRIPRLEMIYSPFDMPFEHCYGVTVMHLAQDACEIITMAQTIAPEKIIEIDCSDYPYTAYFDYGKKEVGTKGVFYPTGDVDKDIHTIREMYRGVTACHPENFVQV